MNRAKAAFAKLYPTIAPLYNESDRVYHNIQHVKDLIRNINELDKYVDPLVLQNISESEYVSMFIAALGHDAYYDAKLGSPVNEQISLGITLSAMRDIDMDLIRQNERDTICDCIQWSAFHSEKDNLSTKNPALLVFLDLDLLGFSEEDYSDYKRNTDKIVQEFMNYGYKRNDILKGRKAFLENLVNNRNGKIYRVLKPKYNVRAMKNITREISDLSFV